MKKQLLNIAFGLLGFSLNAQLPSNIPTNGLFAYYPFNGNANDVSGNGKNGVLGSSSPSLTFDRHGNANAAYTFDGVGNFMRVNYVPFTNPPFTISTWVKLSDLNQSYPMVCLGHPSSTGGTNKLYFAANLANSGTPSIGRYGQNNITSSVSNVNSNIWTHLVVTVNSYSVNDVTFYVNGQQQGTNTLNGNTSNPFPLNNDGFGIGYAQGFPSGVVFFKGALDDIGIWNRILSPSEIQTIYSDICTTTDVSSGLVADYPFSGNANDASANSNNGIVNGATLTTDRFGNPNSAYYFDGVNDYIETVNNNIPSNINNGLSVSLWIKAPQNSTSRCAIQKTSSVTSKGFAIGLESAANGAPIDGNFRTVFNPIDSYTQPRLDDNAWHNIISIWDGSTLKQFVDGQFLNGVTTTSTNLNFDNPDTMTIGCYKSVFYNFSSGSFGEEYKYFFQGTIDDIKVYNRSLTDCDIDSLYSSLNQIANGVNENLKNLTVTIYPNPSYDFIEIKGVDLMRFEIINLIGETIISSNSINNNIINISDLKNGIYLITITDSKGKKGVKKIIKQ